MHGGSCHLIAMEVLEKFIGVKPLLRKLILQMGNCVKDNKNCQLFTLLPLLTIREVLEEKKLGFLVVGHTTKDIDGDFGYLSKKLREQDNYVLAKLMKTFMVSQNHPFILQLIQDILDFKTWVKGCLKDRLEI